MNSYYIIDSNVDQNINKVLNDYAMYTLLGSASSYDDAMNDILKFKPNVVFVNLELATGNPFQFISELNCYLDIMPDFVAISKTTSLAYEAIKHNFVDYILKPINEVELRKFALKYKKNQDNNKQKLLCLKSYQDYQYINTDEIVFLKADNNTTDFHTNRGKVISAYKTLKVFENMLPENFLRIHKSYIVNKDYVSRINFGNLKCTVDNMPQKIPFTKTYLTNIEFIKSSLTELSLPGLN